MTTGNLLGQIIGYLLIILIGLLFWERYRHKKAKYKQKIKHKKAPTLS